MSALRHDGGQALVVVALSMAALLGAVALALDWGFGLTQRRVAQNSSDAAALAAARTLATSVLLTTRGFVFTRTQEEVWCAAAAYQDASRSFAPSGATWTFTVQLSANATSWSTISPPTACPAAGATAVPSSVRYVRVESGVTYRALVAAIVGHGTVRASAAARARVVGSTTPALVAWPFVRHYDPDAFDAPCSGSCDPATVAPTTFWSANADQVVYGNFKGLVDLSRYSTRLTAAPTAQLIDLWDTSGTAYDLDPATTPKPDRSSFSGAGQCGGPWDTQGGHDPANGNKACDIPNWAYYAFGGRLSLDRDWSTALPVGQEAPSALGPRPAVCATPPSAAPSCGAANDRKGDWVETAYGNLSTNISDGLRAHIQARGSECAYSDRIVAGGPNRGNQFGRCVVILVHLWDCAETYSSAAPLGSRWDLVLPSRGTDCSALTSTGNAPTPQRVHIFSVAPFTFYEGLVTANAVEGYWGGAFGDPGSCPACDINAFANSALLVPDE